MRIQSGLPMFSATIPGTVAMPEPITDPMASVAKSGTRSTRESLSSAAMLILRCTPPSRIRRPTSHARGAAVCELRVMGHIAHRKRLLIWLALSLTAAANPYETRIETPSVDAEFEAPNPIINGVVEDGYPAAVGLGTGGYTACSGSIITPRLVLTAAHCGGELPVELIVQFGEAYIGRTGGTAEHVLRFSDSAIHPEYRALSGSDEGAFDLGILVLTEDAPVEPVWPRLTRLGAQKAEGAEVLSVGYGVTETGSSGEKRSASFIIDELDPMFLLSNVATNPGDTSICSGDSGGPQYFIRPDGSLEQWGVHSWGDQNCSIVFGSTRTDVASDWIREQIEATHGTSDRCEIFGLYEDDACDTECDFVDPGCYDTFEGYLKAATGMSIPGATSGCVTAPASIPLPVAADVLVLGARRER